MSSQEGRCDDDTNHYLTITHSLAMCLAKKVDVMMTPTTTYRHSIEDIILVDEKINVTTTEKLTKTEYLKTTHLLKQATNLCTIYNVHSQHRINYVDALCF